MIGKGRFHVTDRLGDQAMQRLRQIGHRIATLRPILVEDRHEHDRQPEGASDWKEHDSPRFDNAHPLEHRAFASLLLIAARKIHCFILRKIAPSLLTACSNLGAERSKSNPKSNSF
jgi:hypothetical protein